jgi:hypothetical protein
MMVSRGSPSAMTLAWFAFGATILAAAFSVHPVKTSPFVFWAVLLIGAAILAIGGLSHFKNRTPKRQLTASECRRVYEALKKLLDDQGPRRPRGGMFHANRHDAWLARLIERYEDDLQKWARKVFHQAVKADALSEASRPLLDAKTETQLGNLRDLFRGAAEELERRD